MRITNVITIGITIAILLSAAPFTAFTLTNNNATNTYTVTFKLEDFIYSKLNTPPWYIKSSGLKILALRRDPDSVRYIKNTLSEPNAEVRRSAAKALGEIGGEKALALLSELSKDKNAFVRKSAEKALNKASHLKFT